jgi:hypothetical protein
MKISMRNFYFDRFGRPLAAGTSPTEQQENINDKYFTSTNVAAHCGRGLAQLSNKKLSMINGSL